MGGGTMLRYVANLASLGAAARGGATAAAAAICSTCSRGAPNGPLRAATATSSDVGASPSQPLLQSGGPQRWCYDQEDWAFAGDELERPEYSIRDHLVFGKPPTHEEVKEATLELQSALSLGLVVAPEAAGDGFLPPFSTNEGDATYCDHENVRTEGRKVHPEQKVDWIEPQLVYSGRGNIQAGYVAEAFHWLQTTPKVQGVVMSLAQDKAVWDAILNNDKVKEFRQQLQESGGHFNLDNKDLPCNDGKSEEKADSASGGFNFLFNLFEGAKNTAFHVKEILMDFIKNMLFTDKNLAGEKDRDTADWTVKSCFMLAMIVTFIVLVKRVGAV
ncbi:hypothetical protein O6H91_09G009700 [Diphasiastrum complanatum]|uniref:Uncharacterized protein n=1 Tax=Diphasiastrum complanatum TaxID=34168 RepID=A0ACC2CL72_DIPCM|nr:hypothetical protein O6H91_09G009700 [Diphasiastrum complanatum]